MKLHHSLTDGVGGIQLALLLFDLEARARLHREPLARGPRRPNTPNPAIWSCSAWCGAASASSTS